MSPQAPSLCCGPSCIQTHTEIQIQVRILEIHFVLACCRLVAWSVCSWNTRSNHCGSGSLLLACHCGQSEVCWMIYINSQMTKCRSQHPVLTESSAGQTETHTHTHTTNRVRSSVFILTGKIYNYITLQRQPDLTATTMRALEVMKLARPNVTPEPLAECH